VRFLVRQELDNSFLIPWVAKVGWHFVGYVLQAVTRAVPIYTLNAESKWSQKRGFSFAVQVLDRQNQASNLRFPRASCTSLNFKGWTEGQSQKGSFFLAEPVLRCFAFHESDRPKEAHDGISPTGILTFLI